MAQTKTKIFAISNSPNNSYSPALPSTGFIRIYGKDRLGATSETCHYHPKRNGNHSIQMERNVGGVDLFMTVYVCDECNQRGI
jgi:hypothetical protein